MSRFHPGWGRSSKSTEDVRVYVDPTSHVEEIEMTSINPETAPISISSSESSNDSSSSLVKPLDNLILGYSASQRKLAQNRWQFVRSKLPIIRAMSTSSLFEGVDPLIKNHLNDDIYNVSQAFRISLIVLLFIAAFSITGYQWSTWYTSNRESLFSLSDTIVQQNALTIQSAVRRSIAIPPLYNQLNALYQKTGYTDWTDFSTTGIIRSTDILYRQLVFNGVYSAMMLRSLNTIWYNNLAYPYFATSDMSCDGNGRFIAVELSSNSVNRGSITIDILDPNLSNCVFVYARMPTVKNTSDWRNPTLPLVPEPEWHSTKSYPWYAQAVAKKSLGWTEPYGEFFSEGDSSGAPRPYLTLTSFLPLYSSKNPTQLLGVLGCDLYLDEFSNLMKQIKIGKTGVIFIVTSTGMLVSSSSGMVMKTNPVTPIFARESDDPIVRSTTKYLESAYGSWDKIVFLSLLRDPEMIIVVRVVRDVNGLNWRIVLSVPTSDFQSIISDDYRLTLAFGICTLLILLCSILYITIIVRQKNLKKITIALSVRSKDREERSIKLNLKRQRDQFINENPGKPIPEHLDINFEGDEGWLQLAITEEKEKENYRSSNYMSDKLEKHRRYYNFNTMTRIVVALLTTVIVVNMILWLIWIGTVRTQSVASARDLLSQAATSTGDSAATLLLNAVSGVSLVNDYQLVDMTLQTGIRNFSFNYTNPAIRNPPLVQSVPAKILALQSLLCTLREYSSLAHLYMVAADPTYAFVLGCYNDGNGNYITALDKTTNGEFVKFPSSKSFQRMPIISKSFYVVDANFSPYTEDWFKLASISAAPATINSATTGGWSQPYPWPSNKSQLAVTYFSPIFSFEDKLFMGAIGCDVNLSGQLKPLMISANINLPGSTNFVVDHAGSLVAMPNGEVMNKSGRQINAIESTSPLVRAAIIHISTSMKGIGLLNAYPAVVDSLNDPLYAYYEIQVLKWIYITVIPSNSLFSESDRNARKTFWLLFSEFSILATIATIIFGLISRDSGASKDKSNFQMKDELKKLLKTSNQLKHVGGILPIYERLRRNRHIFFEGEIEECSSSHVINSVELEPEKHHAWLSYLHMAEQNYNVENIWILRRFYGNKSWSLRLYMLETNPLYRLFIVLVIVGFCFTAFWEPANWAIFVDAADLRWGPISCEILFILLMIIDMALRTWLANQLRSFKIYHFLFQLIFCVCFLADWIGYVSIGCVRWSRLLRPLYLLYRIPQFRDVALLVLQSCVDAAAVILIFFYVIIVSDIVAISLVGGSSVNDFATVNFDNLFSSFVNMFILVASSLNYSDSFGPSVNSSAWYMLFWTTVTIIGTFIVLTTLIAQFSNTYAYHSDIRKNRMRIRRWMAVSAAFIIFDSANNGKLTRREFTIFVATYLRTKHRDFDQLLLESAANLRQSHNSEAVSESLSDGAVDINTALQVNGLPSYVHDLIKACFHVLDASGDGAISMEEFERGFDLATLAYSVTLSKYGLLKTYRNASFILIFNIVSPLVLLFYVLILAAYNSIFLDQTKALDIVLTALLVLMALEVIASIKFTGRGILGFLNDDDNEQQFVNRWEFVLIFSTVIIAIILWIYSAVSGTYLPFENQLRTFMCIPLLRIFTCNRNLLRVVKVLIELTPACSNIVILVLVIFYEYASLGGVFFSGVNLSSYANFNTFLNCWIHMYWLFIGESWNSPMTAAILATSSAALWFFVTWIFLIKILLTNLVFGVIINKFTDFLMNPTNRLIHPRLRKILTGKELDELRLLCEKVIRLIDERKNDVNVKRAQKMLSTFQFSRSRPSIHDVSTTNLSLLLKTSVIPAAELKSLNRCNLVVMRDQFCADIERLIEIHRSTLSNINSEIRRKSISFQGSEEDPSIVTVSNPLWPDSKSS